MTEKYLLVTKSKYISVHDLFSMARMAEMAYQAFRKEWFTGPITFHVSTDGTPKKGFTHCLFTDETTDDGALAWHDEEGGTPFIVEQIANVIASGGAIFSGPGCVFSAFMHEIFEEKVNPNCNRFVLKPDGDFLALETCDPVEEGEVNLELDMGGGQKIPFTSSNFVFPNYFDAQGKGPFDLLGDISAPFQNEGYQIIYNPKTGFKDVWTSEEMRERRHRKVARTDSRYTNCQMAFPDCQSELARQWKERCDELERSGRAAVESYIASLTAAPKEDYESCAQEIHPEFSSSSPCSPPDPSPGASLEADPLPSSSEPEPA